MPNGWKDAPLDKETGSLWSKGLWKDKLGADVVRSDTTKECHYHYPRETVFSSHDGGGYGTRLLGRMVRKHP